MKNCREQLGKAEGRHWQKDKRMKWRKRSKGREEGGTAEGLGQYIGGQKERDEERQSGKVTDRERKREMALHKLPMGFVPPK